MKAVILAAGKGSRLWPLTERVPKAILPIDNLTIFDRMVLSLAELPKLEEIIIVTGYESAMLENHIKDVTTKLTREKLNFRLIHNEKFNKFNNIYSFWLAVKELQHNFILLNSDIVFHTSILRKLFYHPGDAVLVIDSTKKLGHEEMKVKVHNGFIKDIRKTIRIKDASGEYVGMLKMSNRIAEQVIKNVEWLISNRRTDEYYEEAVAMTARRSQILFPLYTNNLPWTEIDTISDIYYAKQTILPLIKSQSHWSV